MVDYMLLLRHTEKTKNMYIHIFRLKAEEAFDEEVMVEIHETQMVKQQRIC